MKKENKMKKCICKSRKYGAQEPCPLWYGVVADPFEWDISKPLPTRVILLNLVAPSQTVGAKVCLILK